MTNTHGYTDVSCLLCGSEKRHLKYKKLHMGYPIFVQKCDDCDFLYFSPRPTPEIFNKIYEHDYFKDLYQHDFPKDHTPNFSKDCHFRAKNLAENFRLKKIIAFQPPAQDCLIEIGCGFGYQLMAAKSYFKYVAGIELNHEAACHTRGLGFTVFEQPAEECDFPSESADVVTMYTVIEHVMDPMKVLHKVYSWLKPQGLLVLQTGNANSLNLKKQGVNSSMICIDHVSFFSDKTLKFALKKSGFVLEKLFYHRGLSAAEERQCAEIQHVEPLLKTNPTAAKKMSRRLDFLCTLRALNFFGITWNISMTAICRKPTTTAKGR